MRRPVENKIAKQGLVKARRIAKASTADFSDKPNVVYATVGEKVTKGAGTGIPSIVIYVRAKKNVSRSDTIPKRAIARSGRLKGESIQTDIVELLGEPVTFGARVGHVLRSFDGDIGVCGLAFIKNGIGYVLSNAHVFCDVSHGGRNGVPGLLNRETNQYISVGPTVYATPILPNKLNIDDCAVARSDGLVVDHLSILDFETPIARFGNIQDGLQMQYWYSINGAIFGCDRPEPVITSVPINVDGWTVPYSRFWQFRMTKGIASKGHSGALLCRSEGNAIVACGLVFGGVTPNLIYAFPIVDSYNRALQALP